MEEFPLTEPPHRPLTAEELDDIEEVMDMVIEMLFEDPVDRQEALDDDLITKLQGYLEIAHNSLTGPLLEEDAELLGDILRDLIESVEAHYLALN